MCFFKKLKNKKTIKEINNFFQENKINFYHAYLVIDGNVINEFNYLIRYISDTEVENFDDLNKVIKNKDMLINSIEKELSRKILNEEAHFNISNVSARKNMEDLKKIILIICILNEYAKSLNYSIDEILNIFKNQEIRNEAKN